MARFQAHGMSRSWALLGMEYSGQRTVIQCVPDSLEISRGYVDVSQFGSAYVTSVPGNVEIRSSMCGGRQVVAATYSDCLRIIAETWSPDGSTPDGWRPVPR